MYSSRSFDISSSEMTHTVAGTAYEAVREYSKSIGDFTAPQWDAASSEEKEEAYDKVDFYVNNYPSPILYDGNDEKNFEILQRHYIFRAVVDGFIKMFKDINPDS